MTVLVVFMSVFVLAFALVSCGDGASSSGGSTGPGGPGGTPGVPQSVSYSGTAGSVTYTLIIYENTGWAAYVPVTGDVYELTAGTKSSYGVVTGITGLVYTLTPYVDDDPEDPFFVTVTAAGGISAISGTITWEDGDSDPAPSTFTPVTPGPDTDTDPDPDTEPDLTAEEAKLLGMWYNSANQVAYLFEKSFGSYEVIMGVWDENRILSYHPDSNTFNGMKYEYSGTTLTINFQDWEPPVPSGTAVLSNNNNTLTISGITHEWFEKDFNGTFLKYSYPSTGTLTITNPPEDYIGVEIYSYSGDITSLVQVNQVNISGNIGVNAGKYQGSQYFYADPSEPIDLAEGYDGDFTEGKVFVRNGTYTVRLIVPGETGGQTFHYYFAQVQFTDGNATVDFSAPAWPKP